MSIVCSIYVNNALQFIDKGNNGFRLHTINDTEQERSDPVLLSSITGYPNSTDFDGLCSYSIEKASMYLSFSNSTVSTIHELHLNDTRRFSATQIQLHNTTLHSFSYTSNTNHKPIIAYISSNQTQHRTLNVTNLVSNQSISSPIDELSVLTSAEKSIFVIQPNSITEYRVDLMKYANKTVETRLSKNAACTALTVNETSQFISIYDPTNKYFDIYYHNTLNPNYTDIPFITSEESAALNPNATNATVTTSNTTPSGSATSKPSLTDTSRPQEKGSEVSRTRTSTAASSITDINGSATTTTTATQNNRERTTSSATSTDETSKSHDKRDIILGEQIPSSDGSYNVKRTTVSSNNDLPLAVAAIRVADDPDQEPPYNILILSGDPTGGYRLETVNGAIILQQPSTDPRGLSGGDIAGIVIGILAFIGIILGAIWYSKKRKGSDRHSIARNYRSMPLSIQPGNLESPVVMMPVNEGHTSSILQETKYVPEEYRDTSRPDIRPLSYFNPHIKFAQLSDEELLALEPDVPGPLHLFSGLYLSSPEEKVTYIRDGYAIRTFDANDGIKHSIHYFSSSNLGMFVQSVNAVLCCTTENKESNQYIMKSKQGIVLCKPTPTFNYQYIWITSPMIPEHSLYYLLFERKTRTFVDHHNPDYKIWSVYAVLKGVETLHRHEFVHLAIDLRAFYYDHETKATDWRLGNFGFSQPKEKSTIPLPPYTSFTAPEIIRSNQGGGFSADIWSLACVIYTIATGGQLLFENDIHVKNLMTFNDDMKQHLKISIRDNIENEVFKVILQDMLQVDPVERKSISHVLDYWNQIYNMEE